MSSWRRYKFLAHQSRRFWGTYRIGSCPSSSLSSYVVCQHLQTTFPLKPLGPNFIWCILWLGDFLFMCCFFLWELALEFACNGNLCFPLTYNGENWKSALLPSSCRYFDKTFIKCSLEILYQPYIFGLLLVCIGCHGNQSAKIEKKYLKIITIYYLMLRPYRNTNHISLCRFCLWKSAL